MPSSAFARFRLTVFSLVSYFSIAGLVLAYFAWNVYAFAIGQAVAILTLITIPPLILLSILRKGAFPCMIIVEYIYTGTLWVLWLAVVVVVRFDLADCLTPSRFSYSCPASRTFLAFSVVNWLLLLTYNQALFTLTILANRRVGGGVWTSYVSEVDFSANAASRTTLPQTAVPQNFTPVVAQTPQGIVIPQAYFVPQQSVAMSTYPEPSK